MQKALSTAVLGTLRDWVKGYVSDHSPQTIAFSINFETGNIEYSSGSDIVFTVNTVTGDLEYK